MRNITCTEARLAGVRPLGILTKKEPGRSCVFVGVLLLLADAAGAQEMPREGCYFSSYEKAHLDAHPAQVVESMRMHVATEDDLRFVALEVRFADQGHAGRDGSGGRVLTQVLNCFKSLNGVPFCGVECDGGSFTTVRQDDAGLTLRTGYLMIGDTEGCGGVVDLAEVPWQSVSYRLDRVPATQCEGM